MSSHESRWLIHPLCGVLGTRRKQLGQHRQQYQQDGDQCTGAGRGTRSRAGWVLQHAHHPGPGPVVGQGGDACHLAHEVVDIHDSDGSSSEVGFEIWKGKARKQVVKATPGMGRAEGWVTCWRDCASNFSSSRTGRSPLTTEPGQGIVNLEGDLEGSRLWKEVAFYGLRRCEYMLSRFSVSDSLPSHGL